MKSLLYSVLVRTVRTMGASSVATPGPAAAAEYPRARTLLLVHQYSKTYVATYVAAAATAATKARPRGAGHRSFGLTSDQVPHEVGVTSGTATLIQWHSNNTILLVTNTLWPDPKPELRFTFYRATEAAQREQ